MFHDVISIICSSLEARAVGGRVGMGTKQSEGQGPVAAMTPGIHHLFRLCRPRPPELPTKVVPTEP